MKYLMLLSIIICTLLSCSKAKFDVEQFPQEWKLVKMTGSIPNSDATGADMDWQETYVLNADDTFTKSREREGQLTEESGSFSFEDFSEGKYLILNYANDNALIGNCTRELKETLKLKSSNRLSASWEACDGPGLEYRRIN